METSLLVFFTNFWTISLAKSIVISALLNDDWAIREIIAPSNSLTFVFIFLATYSIISWLISTPSRYNLFFNIDILVSKSGNCSSAERPHLNLYNKRCSISCISTGALSDVNITCLPFWWSWLKIWKNTSWVPLLPERNWTSSIIKTSKIW